MDKKSFARLGRGARLGLGLAAAALVAAVALPQAGFARPGGHRGGHHSEQRVEALDLDAETQAAVDAIFDAGRDERRALRREMRAQHEQMRALYGSGTASESELNEQAEAMSALMLAKQKQRIARHLALREVLTPEQLAQLAERPKRGHHGKKCRGHGSGDGPDRS